MNGRINRFNELTQKPFDKLRANGAPRTEDLSTLPLVHIEQQQFGFLAGGDNEVLLGFDLGAIPGFELRSVEARCSSDEMQIGGAPAGDAVGNLFARAQQAGIDIGILMNADAALAAIAGRYQPQPPALVFGSKEFLLITRLDANTVRHDPDLEKVHQRARGGIELAMLNARACTHALH